MTNAKKPTAAMVEAGVDAWRSVVEAMEAREASEAPEQLPDYDEGDVATAIYTAMRALEPAAPVEDGEVAREIYGQGFRDGFVEAHVTEDGPPVEEDVLRNLSGVSIAEGWDARVSTFGSGLGQSHARSPMEEPIEAIPPRQPPAADALVLYAPVVGETMDEWRENVRKTELYQHGDTVLVWVNESDLYERLSLAKLQGGGE